MFRIIIILLLANLFGSCINAQNYLDRSQCEDEDELINQVLWQLILMSPPCDDESMSQEENEIFWSEFYSKLRDGTYKVYLIDSLVLATRADYHKIKIPNEFSQLYYNLILSQSLKSRKFDIPKNPTEYNIEIFNQNKSDPQYNQSLFSNNCLGEIAFSRIIFNEKKLKACLIQSIRRMDCNKAYLICLEKQNDRWKVLKVILLRP